MSTLICKARAGGLPQSLQPETPSEPSALLSGSRKQKGQVIKAETPDIQPSSNPHLIVSWHDFSFSPGHNFSFEVPEQDVLILL